MLSKLFKNILLVFSITTFCRLVFWILNSNYFDDVNLGLFFYGLRFDAVSIAYLFSGYFLLLLFPFKNSENKWLKKGLGFSFQLGLNLTLLSNLIDSVYYNFTFKRSTGDVFTLVGTGDDVERLIPQFLRDYWYVVLVYVASVWFFTKVYKRINKSSRDFVIDSYKTFLKRSIGFVLGVTIMIISARGGVQLRPLNMADAPRYAKGEGVAVLVNTPFSILLTIQNSGVKKLNFFKNNQELADIYNPIQKVKNNPIFKGRNVVVIILESFAEEYIGHLSGKKSYTPFLDSLLRESFVFKNNRSNGLKSIEALPSIFAGIPSLSNSPFILSPYASNKIQSLPDELSKLGYNTSFYHAGETGTMAFDAFCKNAGIDHYFGQENFPEKDKYFDGAWGIYDEPYLSYFADELSKKQEPFFSAVFTLSSHHPYSIPIEYENRFDKGNLKVHETIGYTDHALKKYFEKAADMDWFENSIFVITADHPAQSEYQFYKKAAGRFKVPLAIYDPTGILKGESQKVSKHSDISKTVLGLVTDSVNVLSFGQDLFNDSSGFCVNYYHNTYIIRNGQYILSYNFNSSHRLFAEKDSLWKRNLSDKPELKNIKDSLINFGKAYIQQLNNRLIENKLSIE